MKTKTSTFINLIILIFSGLIITNSCGNREETVSCFPNSPINVTLNLSLPAYQNLPNVGGHIYVNEQSSGTRVLILVRSTNSLKSY